MQPRLQAVRGRADRRAARRPGTSLCAPPVSNPQNFAAYGLSATDVGAALNANDYIAGLGTTKGQMVQVTLKASTALRHWRTSESRPQSRKGGAIVRLSDVANVTARIGRLRVGVSFDARRPL